MSTDFSLDFICQALKSVLSPINDRIPLHEPKFGGREWDYVKECLDTGWVSSVGKFVDQFEHDLVEFTGAKYAVAVVNGTAALHISLLLCGVRADDEVLTPALSFVATANAISYCGAVPHFIEVEEKSLGVAPGCLAHHLGKTAEMRSGECFNRETGRRIRAIIPMHTFGHPVDIEPLLEVCSSFNIEVIEDAAESLGSFYKGKHTGLFGRVAALSFNGNKTITTGGGGALLTNDESIARLGKHLTTTAKTSHPWEFNHDMVGYNYRMPNLNAAVGCAQLEQLDRFLSSQRRWANQYRHIFKGISGVKFVDEPKYAHSNFWLNALLLDKDNAVHRDALLRQTNAAGIMTRPVWTLMTKLPMYSKCPRMNLEVAEDLERRLVNIPSSSSIGETLGNA